MSASLANAVEILADHVDDFEPAELKRRLLMLVGNYRRRAEAEPCSTVQGFRVFKRIESSDGVAVWFTLANSVDTFGTVLDSAPLEHFATGARFKLVPDDR